MTFALRFVSLPALMLVACAAGAQSYPVKPVRIVSPFPPGGANDILARIMSPKLSEALGQQIVVENRGGASGNIGAELVAKSAPDGYTLLMGQATNMAANVSLMSKLPFDPIKDFAPITLVASTPNLLVIHPSLPVKTVKELVALAKAKPGALNYASSGSGSPGHVAAEWFKKMAGIQMVHIPYKGAGPALTDLVGGHASLYFTSPISAVPFVQSGRLRMVAVTSAKRSPSLPDVPTIAESGYPDFEISSWWGLFAPAATPRDIVMRVHADVVRTIGLPEVRKQMSQQGADPVTNTPEQFAAYVKAEIAKWARLIKELDIKAE